MPDIRVKKSDGTYEQVGKVRILIDGQWQEPSAINVLPTDTKIQSNAVKAIQPTDHPNLYFNGSEIEALRKSIIENQENPQHARDAYLNYIKGAAPPHKPAEMDDATWPDNRDIGRENAQKLSLACADFMLDPSTSKAKALRDSLHSWTDNKNPYWTIAGIESGMIHFILAWMYDLIYNEGVLTSSDYNHFDDWFQHTANGAIKTQSWWSNSNNHNGKQVTEEGSTREVYSNWRTRQHGPGCAAALVSHDQSMVDRGFNSNLDPTYWRYDLSNQDGTRDLENFVIGSVFPSGYSWDGYARNYGFDAPNETFDQAGKPDKGSGQAYHISSLVPLMFAAEAAAHNGVDAWKYGNEALVRAYSQPIAAQWADTAYWGTGDRNFDHRKFWWPVYRRYPDNQDIAEVVANEDHNFDFSGINPFGRTLPIWGALGDLVI